MVLRLQAQALGLTMVSISWNNKDRDLMELNAEITFADGVKKSLNEKLVWWRSGVTLEEFSYTYNN